MAKKPTIKTFDKCFQEMKRLSGNSLSDEKNNEFLDEIKIKINEDKFRNGEEQTKKILEKANIQLIILYSNNLSNLQSHDQSTNKPNIYIIDTHKNHFQYVSFTN